MLPVIDLQLGIPSILYMDTAIYNHWFAIFAHDPITVQLC